MSGCDQGYGLILSISFLIHAIVCVELDFDSVKQILFMYQLCFLSKPIFETAWRDS